MKTKPKVVFSSTTLALAALLVMSSHGCKQEPAGQNNLPASPSRVTPANTTSFEAVTRHLDPGGSFYLYLDTASWLEGLSAKVAGWQNLLTSLPDMSESDKTGINQVFHFLTRIIQTSGVEEISGVGASGVLRQNNLYYNKFILHHYPDRNSGLLWSLFGDTPRPFASLDLMPTSTVFASESELNLARLWEVIQKEIQDGDVPQVTEMLQQFNTNFAAQAGLPLDQLLDSLPGPFLMALTLEESRQVQVPLGPENSVPIPEPSLALAIRTQDDTLFQLVEKLLPKEMELIRVDKPGLKMRTLNLPIPLPIPLRPTFAQTDQYFFLTTQERLVEDMLAVQEGTTPGLKSTEEFQTLSADIPREGNSYSFQSRRFGQALGGMLRSAMAAAQDQGGPPADLINKLFNVEQASFAVSGNTSEGWLVTANGSQHPGAVFIASTLALPTSVAAVTAGLMLPALAKAKSKAQRINCMSNLKQIGLAARMYANDHEEVIPKDILDMRNELGSPKILFCPADPDKPTPVPTDWDQVDLEQISYEFLAPGSRDGDPQKALFRCRIDGNTCFADGHVESGAR